MKTPIFWYGLVAIVAAYLGAFGPDPFAPLYEWVHTHGGLVSVLSQMGAVL